jgi:hypothetical protein
MYIRKTENIRRLHGRGYVEMTNNGMEEEEYKIDHTKADRTKEEHEPSVIAKTGKDGRRIEKDGM